MTVQKSNKLRRTGTSYPGAKAKSDTIRERSSSYLALIVRETCTPAFGKTTKILPCRIQPES